MTLDVVRRHNHVEDATDLFCDEVYLIDSELVAGEGVDDACHVLLADAAVAVVVYEVLRHLSPTALDMEGVVC